ncbi:hypothetical protein AMTRI_Chr13g90020 [Amborella trichopoda]
MTITSSAADHEPMAATTLQDEVLKRHRGRGRTPLKKLFRVASVACGIQFGWALQLSLLTPYVQELGISHACSSLIWLCGPLSGLVVQPIVGYMSDRCKSKWGRRRPFIGFGALLIAFAMILIGHSADIGGLLGDHRDKRPRAIVVFVLGFWVLDVANNTVQGPCRALLADLAGKDQRRLRRAHAYFSLFMAVGNILGFATGSYSGWFKIFPFSLTSACNSNCANLKSAFILGIILLAVTTCLSITAAQEMPRGSNQSPYHEVAGDGPLEPGEGAQEPFLWELFWSLRFLSRPMRLLLVVNGLTWIAWFPFLLFDTDWMGREVYHGDPSSRERGQIYHDGVRMGAFGLLLNSVVIGITSAVIEPLCRKLGAGFVWGFSNILMSLCFISMLIIAFVSEKMELEQSELPSDGIVIAALVVFALLGVPLAVTYSVPYALAASYTESLGMGQGLSMGVLNLSIVIPQVVVSLGSGPWDQLFGSGNSPAFFVAAVSAFAGGLLAIIILPKFSPEKGRGIP